MSDLKDDSSKTPMVLAEEELRCEEHEVVLYEAGGNYGRCCSQCGDVIGEGWLPHDELTEADKEQAIENRREIKDRFRDRVWRRAEEIRRERAPALKELHPGRDATPKEWRDTFDILDDEPKEIREELRPELYDDYLDSEVWRETRQRVFEEKGEECEAKLSVCEGTATAVHHRSYKHLGTEPMWDLMPVCSSCHNVLHRVEEEDNFPGDESSASSDPDSSPEIDYDDLFDVPALKE